MIIHTIPVGGLETNCYLVEEEKTKEALIIDPGAEPEKILKKLKELNLKVRFIINTHGHYDHIEGNLPLKGKVGAPVLGHELDSSLMAMTSSLPADSFLKEDDKISLGSLSFTVLHTPGHTPGGICLYEEKEKVLFSGDTLFAGGEGRTDLPYSSPAEMEKSLKKLSQLPASVKVYPGHGPATAIGIELGSQALPQS